MEAKYSLSALLPQIYVGLCLLDMLDNKEKTELFTAPLHWG